MLAAESVIIQASAGLMRCSTLTLKLYSGQWRLWRVKYANFGRSVVTKKTSLLTSTKGKRSQEEFGVGSPEAVDGGWGRSFVKHKRDWNQVILVKRWKLKGTARTAESLMGSNDLYIFSLKTCSQVWVGNRNTTWENLTIINWTRGWVETNQSNICKHPYLTSVLPSA